MTPIEQESGASIAALEQSYMRLASDRAVGTTTYSSATSMHVALLTGGGDKPYALGLAAAVTSAGTSIDFIGSDDLTVPELLNNPLVNFFNLRGDQRPNINLARKVARVSAYYW